MRSICLFDAVCLPPCEGAASPAPGIQRQLSRPREHSNATVYTYYYWAPAGNETSNDSDGRSVLNSQTFAVSLAVDLFARCSPRIGDTVTQRRSTIQRRESVSDVAKPDKTPCRWYQSAA